jgi:chromosome segregation ATPase
MSAEDTAELERLRREVAALEERAEQLRGTLEATRSEAAGAAAEREQLQLQRSSLLAEHKAMQAQVLASNGGSASFVNALGLRTSVDHTGPVLNLRRSFPCY